ncbi:hypothetical protein TNCV_3569491 [Trichonephila clavipes]|nr:hypothetical protein TNCV_3569491 [Trichonephila clavipes]
MTNAHSHRANIVDDLCSLQPEDITHMDWPTYSPPDLNSIEHVGICLGRRIAARCEPLPPVYRNFGSGNVLLV